MGARMEETPGAETPRSSAECSSRVERRAYDDRGVARPIKSRFYHPVWRLDFLISNPVGVASLAPWIRPCLLGATADEYRANIDWKSSFSLQRSQLDPKFSSEGIAPLQPFSYDKTRLNGLSCGVRMWSQLSFVLSQITRLTDRRTDGPPDRQRDTFLVASPPWHYMQCGKSITFDV